VDHLNLRILNEKQESSEIIYWILICLQKCKKLTCCSVVFWLFFVMNLILWSKGSSAAVPFTTLIALLALWFGVSVPLTFIGAYFGFRKRVWLEPYF
jgi:hypothetical protein